MSFRLNNFPVVPFKTRQLKQGDGWRIGWSPNADVFKGLVGANVWSLELTASEFKDFCRLALQLSDTMAAMADELMDEERISCEAESESVWLEVEGFPHAYTLHLMLLGGRRGEGLWADSVVPKLLQALQEIWVDC